MIKVLQGKTALVTGGSRGLGRAIARHLAASGALVAINYASNEAAARESLAAVEAAEGKGFILQKRLGTLQAAQELAAMLEAELIKRTGDPGLDILVNNAGGGSFGDYSIGATTLEDYETFASDNMGNPFWTTKAVMPRLRQNGSVIFLGSAASRNALQQFAVYAMCKSAVNTLTVIMAKELGPRGINVNCIVPGFIHTDVNDAEIKNPETKAYFEKNTAMRRIGEPDDLAAAVRDLCTPSWAYVTGQIIEVSGGLFL
jgi:NAD(P)-dependent dehydrogenase (short-subunit alcohol dehydrogenase family)